MGVFKSFYELNNIFSPLYLIYYSKIALVIRELTLDGESIMQHIDAAL